MRIGQPRAVARRVTRAPIPCVRHARSSAARKLVVRHLQQPRRRGFRRARPRAKAKADVPRFGRPKKLHPRLNRHGPVKSRYRATQTGHRHPLRSRVARMRHSAPPFAELNPRSRLLRRARFLRARRALKSHRRKSLSLHSATDGSQAREGVQAMQEDRSASDRNGLRHPRMESRSRLRA